jgi:hypothetical protein
MFSVRHKSRGEFNTPRVTSVRSEGINEAGFVIANYKVLVLPLNEVATVKTAECALIPQGFAFCRGTCQSFWLLSIPLLLSVPDR